jgi:hypothetical protein
LTKQERRRQSSRKWARNNKDKVLANSLKWNRNNPVKVAISKQKYYEKHKDKILAKTREWFGANPRKNREYSWKQRGILNRQGKLFSWNDYSTLLREFKNRCGLCSCNKPGWRSSWCVDHDHKTGIARGILCKHCNILIGHYESLDIKRIQKYLGAGDGGCLR